MIFDIADNAPQDQVDIIKDGLALAQDYFDRVLGGDIPDSVKATITVKIVATGLGNQEPGGGGGVATAFSEGKTRPFFDVAHPYWIQNLDGFGISARVNSLHTAAHEWAHGWQSWLGALDNYHQPLGNALNEGIAEYLAYAVLEDAGILTEAVVDPFMLGSAYRSAELDGPVREIENTVWSGHTGYLAIDWLVDESPSGKIALRTLATEIGRGQTIPDAFRTAFNVELEDFYTQFEAWRLIILADPDNGYANRPTLINIGENTAGATPGDDDIAGSPSADTLAALGGNDKIDGRGGSDKLYGNEDNDTLIGGTGKDTLDGGLGRDTASYETATAKVTANLLTPSVNKGEAKGDVYALIENLAGSKFDDTLTGDNGRNLIAGGAGKDTVSGGKGVDTVTGGKGHDVLSGGAGKDFFRFDVAVKAANSDVISDFKPKDDTIQLDHTLFTGLAVGPLSAAAFWHNTTGKAHDNSDRIIYEEDTGKVFFDADGKKTVYAPVLVATLDGAPHVTVADFVIV